MNRHLYRLNIHLTGGMLWRHTPLCFEIVRRARKLGLAGVSVFQGIDLPPESPSRTAFFRVVRRVPLIVVVVDEEERVRELLEELSGILEGTVATVELVERIHTGH